MLAKLKKRTKIFSEKCHTDFILIAVRKCLNRQHRGILLLSSFHLNARGEGGCTSYNGLYGEAPPERSTFLRLEVYKRVGILRDEE